MTFARKLCILAIAACVQATPRLSRAEGEAGNMWSKFLGKVPEYFNGPDAANEAQNSNQAAAAAASEVQNDELVKEGGSSGYPNPSQITENKWQDQFRQCMESSYGQTSSNSGSSSSSSSSGSGGSGQYGLDQFQNYGNTESVNKQMEKCRNQIQSTVGSYPGPNGGQDFFSHYVPSSLGSYPGALTGSSASA